MLRRVRSRPNTPLLRSAALTGAVDRVVPVDGKPGVSPMMTMTLSCDHRVVDGARAAEFMRDLAATVRSPQL